WTAISGCPEMARSCRFRSWRACRRRAPPGARARPRSCRACGGTPGPRARWRSRDCSPACPPGCAGPTCRIPWARATCGSAEAAKGEETDRRAAELRHGVAQGLPEIVGRGAVGQQMEERRRAPILPRNILAQDDAAHLGDGGLGDPAALELVEAQIDA